MRKIDAVCPACRGPVAFEPGDILMAVQPHDSATYTIACPVCSALTVKRADAAAVGILRAFGVPTVVMAAGHPEAPMPGPPLRLDDLIDLHLLLAGDDWLADLEG